MLAERPAISEPSLLELARSCWRNLSGFARGAIERLTGHAVETELL